MKLFNRDRLPHQFTPLSIWLFDRDPVFLHGDTSDTFSDGSQAQEHCRSLFWAPRIAMPEALGIQTVVTLAARSDQVEQGRQPTETVIPVVCGDGRIHSAAFTDAPSPLDHSC